VQAPARITSLDHPQNMLRWRRGMLSRRPGSLGRQASVLKVSMTLPYSEERFDSECSANTIRTVNLIDHRSSHTVI